MRELVTIQKIKEVKDIPNKDIIGIATFENVGYQVIVDKTTVKKGDLVAYFMVDSLLPDLPEFESVKKYSWKPSLKKCRIKCMSMSKIFSEGLVMPLYKLSNLLKKDISLYKEGDIITDELGVTLYIDDKNDLDFTGKKEPFMKLFLWKYIPFLGNILFGRKIIREFPSAIPKTEETRLQDFPKVLEEYQGELCYITEKIDGSSMTVFLDNDNNFIISTRNSTVEKLPIDKAIKKYVKTKIFKPYSKKGDPFRYLNVVAQLELPKKFLEYKEKTGKCLSLQGELAGIGIQKNRLELNNTGLYIFNGLEVTSEGFNYIPFPDLKNLSKEIGFNLVPIIKEKFSFNFKSLEEISNYSKGKSLLNNKKEREGIVIRFYNDNLKRFNGMIKDNYPSFKVLNPKYLLKLEEEFSKEE